MARLALSERPTRNRIGQYRNNHCFSQIVICGDCGEIFRRVHWNNRGKRSIVWRCASRLENTGVFCDARTVLESIIEQVLITAINTTLKSRDSFLATLQNNIAIVLSQKNDAAIEDIEKKIEEMQILLLKLASAHADIKQVTAEIYRLRDEKQKALVENAGRDDLRKRIAEMSIFLRKQPTVIKEYDEKLVRRLIDKVTVYEDRFEVVFRSGVTVEVEG
jgi:site-specific DNA recombinase